MPAPRWPPVASTVPPEIVTLPQVLSLSSPPPLPMPAAYSPPLASTVPPEIVMSLQELLL